MEDRTKSIYLMNTYSIGTPNISKNCWIAVLILQRLTSIKTREKLRCQSNDIYLVQYIWYLTMVITRDCNYFSNLKLRSIREISTDFCQFNWLHLVLVHSMIDLHNFRKLPYCTKFIDQKWCRCFHS
jgi:hypothetical protein